MLDNIRKMLGIYYHPEYRRMTKIINRMENEETKLSNLRWELIKTRKCLLDNKDEIEAASHAINKNFASLNFVVVERRLFVVSLLDGFPSGIACTIEHISESIRIPREYVDDVLRGSRSVHDDTQLLSNWKQTSEYIMDYYERVEMEEYKNV